MTANRKTNFLLAVSVQLLIVLAGAPEWTRAQTANDSAYRLGAGDQLRVTVFNHQDLSGVHTIDGTGYFSMPLIGSVEARGLSIVELEQTIVDTLKPDYLVNPRVSVQVLNFRPFYILGEVENPDSYPYVDGMTYLNAVAIAGGFTYRAKKKFAMVTPADSEEQKEVKMNMLVRPGDVIQILERRF